MEFKGSYWGNIEIYWDNGKDTGNYYDIIGYALEGSLRAAHHGLHANSRQALHLKP